MHPTRRVLREDALAGLPRPWVVWGRAAVLGPVAFVAGVVSHAVAGGRLPAVGTMLVVLATCLAGAALVLLGRASAGRLALAVLVGQTWVHMALSATAGHHGETPANELPPLVLDGNGSLLDQYRSSTTAASAPGQDWILHQVDHFVAQSPLMLLAHLGGAVVVGLFLSVGEDAFWSLVALAVERARDEARRAALALAALAVLGETHRTGRPSLVCTSVAPRSDALSHPVQRLRGPPFCRAA